MHYAEVQGPINREPDDKLDPSLRQSSQQASGIRRLYVVDSNNLIVVVIDYFFTTTNTNGTNLNCKKQPITTTTTTTCSVPTCTPPTSNSLFNNPSRTNISGSGIDSGSLINLDTFCLIVFLFNIYYMFICFCLPKIIVASLVYLLKEKYVFVLLLWVFFLINDKCARLIRLKRPFHIKLKRVKLKDGVNVD